ncbi:hypothetical protein K438DRAFT_1856945, partial [Mycena galopus ATCC 62051]
MHFPRFEPSMHRLCVLFWSIKLACSTRWIHRTPQFILVAVLIPSLSRTYKAGPHNPLVDNDILFPYTSIPLSFSAAVSCRPSRNVPPCPLSILSTFCPRLMMHSAEALYTTPTNPLPISQPPTVLLVTAPSVYVHVDVDVAHAFSHPLQRLECELDLLEPHLAL